MAEINSNTDGSSENIEESDDASDPAVSNVSNLRSLLGLRVLGFTVQGAT